MKLDIEVNPHPRIRPRRNYTLSEGGECRPHDSPQLLGYARRQGNGHEMARRRQDCYEM